MKWETRDGRRLKVSKMSTQHLMNTVGMLRRTALTEGTASSAVAELYIAKMEKELSKRLAKDL